MAFSAAFLYKVIDRMSPAMKKFKKDNQDLQKQLKANQAQANVMSSRFVQMGKAGSRALQSIKNEGKKVGSMFEVLKKKAKEAKANMGATLRAAGGRMKSMASSTRTASLIATATIMGSVAAHAKFEAGLTATFNLNATKRYSEIGKSIEGVTKKAISMGFGIQGSNSAMFDTVSGMGATERALSTYKEGLILAKAGNSALTPALRAMTSAMEVWEIKAGGAAKVARDLFLAQRIGRTDIETLSGSISRFLPIAKAMGLSFGEAATATAIFTKGGLSTEEAVVSLRGVFSQLSVVQGRAAKTLKALNIPFKVTDVRAAGLTETFRRLLKAQKEHPNAIKMALPNIRAMIGALGLTDEKMKLLTDTLEESKNQTKDNSVVLAAYANVQKTVADNAANMKGELTLALIEMGDKLRPITLQLVKAITWLAKKFTDSGKSTKFLTIAFIVFLAVLSPVLAIAGSVATIIGTIGVAAAGTIALIAALIAVIITITTLMWNNWDAINAWFDSFGMLGTIIKWIVGGPIFWLIAAAKFLIKNWEAVGVFFTALWDGIIGDFKSKIGWIMEKIAWVSNAIGIESSKMEKMAEKLQSGRDTTLKLEEQKKLTVDGFSPQQAPDQRIRADLNINMRDRDNQIESVKTKLFGLDNAGVSFAGGV
ncbi:MAG: phage tail tape measure protein [Chloroflexi bacterium]|nr:MAG: phage tail tape measure protein [Chloroflexota bacterium]